MGDCRESGSIALRSGLIFQEREKRTMVPLLDLRVGGAPRASDGDGRLGWTLRNSRPDCVWTPDSMPRRHRGGQVKMAAHG